MRCDTGFSFDKPRKSIRGTIVQLLCSLLHQKSPSQKRYRALQALLLLEISEGEPDSVMHRALNIMAVSVCDPGKVS